MYLICTSINCFLTNTSFFLFFTLRKRESTISKACKLYTFSDYLPSVHRLRQPFSTLEYFHVKIEMKNVSTVPWPILPSFINIACGYISNKIYCYGGDISNVVNVFRPEGRLYVLDIGQMYGQQSSTFNNKWNEVIASNDFNIEVRRAPESIFFPEQNQIVIVGGFSSNTPFTNQTIAYDTVSNTWKSLPAYSEPDRPRRQMYIHTH